MADLYAALESLDGTALDAFAVPDEEPVAQDGPAAEAVAVAPPPRPVEVEPTGSAPGREHRKGCAMNEAYAEEVARTFSMRVVPWTKTLTPDQAMAAEIDDERVTFSRDGHPWLRCVTVNDLLWAPQAPDYGQVFLRRVLEIEEQPDAVLFHTRDAGLNELVMQGRMEVEAGDG